MPLDNKPLIILPTKVRKTSNKTYQSLIITLPADVARATGIKFGDELLVETDGDEVIITKMKS